MKTRARSSFLAKFCSMQSSHKKIIASLTCRKYFRVLIINCFSPVEIHTHMERIYLQQIDSNKFTSTNDKSPTVLKVCCIHIEYLIISLFNKAFSQDGIPSAWKTAKIEQNLHKGR